MGNAKTNKPKKAKGKNGKPAVPPAFDILTLEEAAALLRVSADGLRADAEKGSVPGRLIAGEWRFARPTLWEWAKSPSANGPRRKVVDLPVSDETPEEQEAYRKRMQEIRDEWGTVGDERE